MSRYSYNPGALRVYDTLFVTPPGDTVIWRYFPLERFVSSLERRQIFLCRAGHLEDEFEGATPTVSEQRLMAWEEHNRLSPESRADYRRNRERARERVAVNCWHIRQHEWGPMYDRYAASHMGIAVKSTVGRLGAAFPQHPNNGQSGLEDIDISTIRYIDYDRDHFPLHQLFNHFIHKRLQFEWENELRVFAMITKQAAEASAAGGTDFEVTEKGLFLPVNVETMIEEIYVAPLAPSGVEQTVHELLQRLGLTSIPVRPSALVSQLSPSPLP